MRRIGERGRGSVVALALILAACAGGEGAGAAFTERDSAGVTIVENLRGSWSEDQSWRLSPEPAVDIGVLEGEDVYQLFQVGGATLLDDGRIVVANGGTGELRYYDGDGRFLKAVGRKGEGPGEFQSMGSPILVGDSIFVYDFRLRRMSVLDREGNFGRSFRVELPGGSFPVPAGIFGDGTVLVTTGFSFRPSRVEGVFRDTALYGRVSRHGDFLDSIGRFPSLEFYVSGTERSAAAVSLPFGRAAQAAVRGQTAYVGVTDRYEIFRYAVDGRLAGVIRTAHEPVAVSDEDVERVKEERLEDAGDNFRRTMERMFANMPIPSTMPAFGRLVVDARAYLWVQEYARPGAERDRWLVYDPGGRLLGMVTSPSDLRVFEIGEDYLLGTWRDDLDVEHVQLYELIKPGA